jgi:16S rRNA (guanine527-N7)-methyltransferase
VRALEAPLRAGLRSLELDLSDEQIGLLLDYLSLIQKWTQVYNLTAVREPEAMITHHLLDSLAVVKPLRAQLDRLQPGWQAAQGDRAARLLDVGSGAGLPGVVLAVCCPALRVDCVDTVAKKAAFIQQVAASLRLANLRGLHDRVERLADPYVVVSSRAFASLPDFVRWSQAALSDGGVWMAMKGVYPEDEVKALPGGVAVFHVEPLSVPGLGAQRCVLWLRRVGGQA